MWRTQWGTGEDALHHLMSAVYQSGYPTSTAPPFTLTTSPVIKPASGVHKNRIGPAISAGSATRPMGMVARARARVGGSAMAGADISVSTHPGATQFTRMPCGASSVARPLVMLITAPLLAA